MSWGGKQVFFSEAFAHQTIAFEPIDFIGLDVVHLRLRLAAIELT